MSWLATVVAAACFAFSAAVAASSSMTADTDSAVVPVTTSVIDFDFSQRRLFEDQARVIVVNWHRQKGKDFTAACKAVDEGLASGQNWFIVALTQAQADETFAKVLKVVEGIKFLLKQQGRTGSYQYQQLDGATIEDEAFVDRDKEIDESFKATARILRLPNGARIVSLPGKNPDALAGRTGNLILTEFGLYPKGGYEHWEVLFPIVTRGGFKIIVISTPRGRNTKFYELFKNIDGYYSVHFCDLVQSVMQEGYQLYGADGKPLPQATDEEKLAAIETFRKIYNSVSKWPREFLCLFTGDLSSLVTWAELENAGTLDNPDGFVYRRFDDKDAVTPDARAALAAVAGSLRGRRIRVGWDVARTKHLSVVWVNVEPPAGFLQPTRLIAVLVMRNCSYEFMRAVVSGVMDLSLLSVGAGDATGLGNESNEALRKRYGERWMPYMFSAPGKRKLASAIKTAFSDGNQTLPPIDGEHKFIATDIYAVQEDSTGGQDAYEETPNELMPESHCDIAWAGGLARIAGATASKMVLRPPQRQKPRGF